MLALKFVGVAWGFGCEGFFGLALSEMTGWGVKACDDAARDRWPVPGELRSVVSAGQEKEFGAAGLAPLFLFLA